MFIVSIFGMNIILEMGIFFSNNSDNLTLSQSANNGIRGNYRRFVFDPFFGEIRK